jgi:hypothetical protein
MGIIRTLKGEDGRPYISLEDLIKEIEIAKINDSFDVDGDNSTNSNFIDIVLKTLSSMEVEYYDKFLFRKKD